MSSERTSDEAVRQLIDRLDVLLEVAGLENSDSARAKLAIALCGRLGGRLDGERLAAVNAARDFWLMGRAAEYNKWLHVFWSSRGERQLSDPIDRLVWCALARPGGLDGYAAEYLILEACDAGIGLDEISEALAEVVPGYIAG
ncbi:hypothetical protein [Stenotrophomonas sp. YAU14D1_LEIMI4_1]|uniref:hypothetical protein n=1 Tax=Stenotrophomonas sp. YAU14D1_LEIMI4_1 TaxID=2072407 RepID=UPI000D53D5A4|nr:hypothetical protein [Stenotrophomonas sp. YAU14D1_LEIMI4_1]AWH24681.1 hypothetical protein C1932_05925 [Stenotrophomonas sp. YAU14D1_LEIMI4_1]